MPSFGFWIWTIAILVGVIAGGALIYKLSGG